MTVPVQTPINSYVYAGSATFGYNFLILSSADLVVTVDSVPATLGVDYTVTGVGNQAGGTIVYSSPLTIGQRVTLRRSTALSRSTDYQQLGDFEAIAINADLDRLWMAFQELNVANQGFIRGAPGETFTALPIASQRANLLLSFDASGNPVVVAPADQSAISVSIQLGNFITSLASLIGSTLLGNIRSLVGAATTVHNVLEGLPVNVLRDVIAGAFDPSVDANYASTTAAINAAISTGRKVYLEPGTWVVENVALAANCELYGDGFKTILKQRASATSNNFVLAYGQTSATDTGTSTNAANIRIHDLTLLGRVDTEGFSQFVHLVHLSGVTDAIIERVQFKAFKGDGLYVGSTTIGNERHNLGVTVRDCLFDGVTNTNRNGISVIDCAGMTIENNRFQNCCQPTMPGAIDIEPDAAFNVVQDIKIVGNKFLNNQGSNGHISIALSDLAYTTPPSGFLIEDNDVDGTTGYALSGIFVRHNIAGTPVIALAARDHMLRVQNNRLVRLARPMWLDGLRNVVVQDNQMRDTKGPFSLGIDFACQLISITGNGFDLVGNDAGAGGAGLSVGNVTYLDIDDNKFIDCGAASGSHNGVDFGAGTSSHVRIRGNTWIPISVMTVAIQKEASHTFTPATNRFWNNDFGGLSGFFQAGFGAKTYDPPSLADGAGTTTTVTALGASLGDQAQASFSLDLQGITLTAYVSAADTISVRFQNESGGTLDLASGVLSAFTTKLA